MYYNMIEEMVENWEDWNINIEQNRSNCHHLWIWTQKPVQKQEIY